MAFNVVITDREYETISDEISILESIGANVQAYQFRDEDDIIKVAKDCDALIFQYAKITKKVIDSLEKCKIIAKYATGIDGVDIEAATGKNICVTNVNDYCVDEVSTHAVALLLCLSRKINTYCKYTANGEWDYKKAYPINSLTKSVIGVIGFGKIARAYIDKIKCYCDEIWVYDKFASDQSIHDFGVKPKNFDEILESADYISIHAPLTDETKHMFNRETFQKMKRTAQIINVARGALISEEDLIWALENDLIAGAALDVLENEPPDMDNPLLKMDNVIVTPHVAWYSTTSQKKLQSTVAQDVARVLCGEKPQNLVNRQLESLFQNKEV